MVTKAQTIERLNEVIRVLEELPPKKGFDLSNWYVCDSTACAVGWAASDPWFRRRRFRLEKTGLVLLPVYRDATNWDAVTEFFGLERDAAYRLFNSDYYKRGSRTDVIRRIRAFVRKLEAE